ncbi:MAG: HAMP domain-containing histidine kinase [Ardenticatenaceae bacterium]|nr:HAMP domain-containing histidine kinase [Ardenticatenaceae bacterium]HBY93700.1 hypothetical protein [Chloroflexota bacterium]
MSGTEPHLSSDYQTTLGEFLKAQSERALYEASLLSKEFIEQGVGPEEIVALHTETLERLLPGVPVMERARIMGLSLQFLLEIMISYGIRYKEYLDLRMTETTRAIQMQMEVERIRAEEAARLEQARAQERMRAQEEAMQSKEEFLAFIAHELRTPMTAIRGSIEYALHRAREEGSERVQKALANAERGLERLMHLSDELLQLSREEQMDLTLRLESLPLREFLEAIIEESRPRATEKGMALRFEPEEPIPTIVGDRQWLLTALDNLISNAIKYTEPDGQVTVRTTNHARRLQIDVIDTGTGIPESALPHIFEKYYRVRDASGGFVKGTGLGLTLVKNIVERHGGDVRVQSQVGRGSTFSIYLPLDLPAADSTDT